MIWESNEESTPPCCVGWIAVSLFWKSISHAPQDETECPLQIRFEFSLGHAFVLKVELIVEGRSIPFVTNRILSIIDHRSVNK